MSYWAELWNELLNIISENKVELLKNPFVWIIIILAGIGIYALYDVPDKVSKNGLGSVVRQLLQVLLDTSSDLINTLRSITGFLSVLRLLLFGNINQKTLQVLINYAIIFMSMASFTTTFAGLQEMTGILAAFISFGVQVSILICATKIAYYINRKNKEPEKILTMHQYSISKGNNEKSESKNMADGNKKSEHLSGKEDTSKRPKESPQLIWIMLIISVFVSSGFSYSFMFRQFISPHSAYDDHFRSLRETQNIILEYSEELNQYRTELAEVLTHYNDNIEQWLDLENNNPYTQLEQEKRLLDTITDLEENLQQERMIYNSAEDGSPEKSTANQNLNDLEKEIRNQKRDLEDIQYDLYEDPIGSSRRAAYESITALTDFYANSENINDELEKELRRDFTYLQQAEAEFLENTDLEQGAEINAAKRSELVNTFENYMSLSKFLANQGGGRISFTEVQQKMQTNYSQDFSAEDYRNSTNEILTEMLNKLNSIPLLTPVENVWSGNTIQAPPQAKYINTINNLYRDNSGRSLELERAVKKLVKPNEGWETWLLCSTLLLLAVIFDSLIITLTMLRETKYSLVDNTELQRLIGILLIDDSINSTSEHQRKSQNLCLTLGFAAGILIFTIYQIGGYNEHNTFQKNTFSLICFISLGLILGLASYKIYYIVYRKIHGWEQEEICRQLKKIFLPDEDSEKRLKQKLEQDEIKTLLSSKSEDIENILAFWMSSLGTRLFLSYFHPVFILLFDEMEMKECVRTSITKELLEGEFKETEWQQEKINLPCLPEHKVANAGAKIEFNILKRRHLVEFAFCEKENSNDKEGFYILTERFWHLLYEAILLRIAGGRITDYDIEEELRDTSDDE